MLSKKNITIVIIGASVTTFLAIAQSAKSNQNNESNRLEGSWVAKVPGTPIQWAYTLSPSDPSGQQAAMSGSIHVKIPVTFMNPDFIDQEYISNFNGEAVMIKHDTAKFTAVWYGLKKVIPSAPFYVEEQVVNIGVTSGQVKYTGQGKAEFTHHIAFYHPEADADGDGLPDPGQTPFLCLPASSSLDTRIGLMQPCTPTTP